jgi:N-carbamoylputrescine amidase
MPTTFRVAVCENPPELAPGTDDWGTLCERVSEVTPHLVLLNEMPFGPWLAADPHFDQHAWRRSCELHERGMQRLHELGAALVAGTRPVERDDGRRLNEAFLHTRSGTTAVHAKQYFPNEPGYFEANWFHAGTDPFQVACADELRAGFLICTEVMFNEHARRYGRAGAHVILVPRAVGASTLERWLVAMRMAAIVSGCYVLTSNRAGTDARGQTFGGGGWIIDPFGTVVARTSPDEPIAWHDIDLDVVGYAQREYPCYVKELSAR